MSSTRPVSVSTQTPARKERRPLTEEQRDVLRARLVKARAMKKVHAERRAAVYSGQWTAHTADLHPALRNVLAVLGPVRRSNEGCDCGEC